MSTNVAQDKSFDFLDIFSQLRQLLQLKMMTRNSFAWKIHMCTVILLFCSRSPSPLPEECESNAKAKLVQVVEHVLEDMEFAA